MKNAASILGSGRKVAGVSSQHTWREVHACVCLQTLWVVMAEEVVNANTQKKTAEREILLICYFRSSSQAEPRVVMKQTSQYRPRSIMPT